MNSAQETVVSDEAEVKKPTQETKKKKKKKGKDKTKAESKCEKKTYKRGALGQAMRDYIDGKGDPDKCDYETAEKLAKKIMPSTKFNKAHWAWYKNDWYRRDMKKRDDAERAKRGR